MRPSYARLLKAVKSHIEHGNFSTDAQSQQRNVLRIGSVYMLYMLQELADENESHGLKMTNKSKTKVMMENDTPIYVKNTQIENVESYINQGQRYSTRDKNQDKETQRRITTG